MLKIKQNVQNYLVRLIIHNYFRKGLVWFLVPDKTNQQKISKNCVQYLGLEHVGRQYKECNIYNIDTYMYLYYMTRLLQCSVEIEETL